MRKSIALSDPHLIRRDVYAVFSGLSTSLILVFPHVDVAGIPLTYLFCIFTLSLGVWSVSEGVSRDSLTCLVAWYIATLIAASTVLIQRPLVSVEILVRMTVCFLAGVNGLICLRSERSCVLFLRAFSAIVLLNSVVAIAQFFGNGFAIEMGAGDVAAGRVSGFQTHPHVFAYVASIAFVLVVFSFFIEKVGLIKVALFAVAAISFVAVLVSLQRSAALSAFFFLALVLIFSLRGRRALVVMSLSLLAIFWIYHSFLSNDFQQSLGVLGRLSNFNSSSDVARFGSWGYAITVISEDPFFGGAYNENNLVLAIHNGFLSGWGQHGVIWAAVVVFSTLITCFHVARQSRSVLVVLTCLGLLSSFFLNTMFHSLSPGRNDMPFMITLGVMLGLCHVSRRKVSDDGSLSL